MHGERNCALRVRIRTEMNVHGKTGHHQLYGVEAHEYINEQLKHYSKIKIILDVPTNLPVKYHENLNLMFYPFKHRIYIS